VVNVNIDVQDPVRSEGGKYKKRSFSQQKPCGDHKNSISDPNLKTGQWIRIRESKNDPQKSEKGKKFHVLK
jgi:hypothetical protein